MFFLFFVFLLVLVCFFFFFFQAEDGIRDADVTGVQTCALPILMFSLSATLTTTSARKSAAIAAPANARSMRNQISAIAATAMAAPIATRGHRAEHQLVALHVNRRDADGEIENEKHREQRPRRKRQPLLRGDEDQEDVPDQAEECRAREVA